jgi:inactivated superfamily I helicase
LLDFDGSESQADTIRQAMRRVTDEARLSPAIREALDILDDNNSVATYSIATGTDPNVFRLMLFNESRDGPFST